MATATLSSRTDLDMDAIRDSMTNERERLESQLRHLREQNRSPNGGGETGETGDLADYDQHDADQGTELFLREQDEALYAQFRSELDALTAAEHRLAEGRFGFCERCSKPIPGDRLELLPSASLCVACAEEQEGR